MKKIISFVLAAAMSLSTLPVLADWNNDEDIMSLLSELNIMVGDDDICTDISGVHGSDIGTILEHSDPVADFKDFRHAVGDVENADSPTAQFLYQIKEPGSLLFREGGGWLIQNQQLAVE